MNDTPKQYSRKKILTLFSFLIIISFLFIWGCLPPPPGGGSSNNSDKKIGVVPPPPPPPPSTLYHFGYSVKGQKIRGPVIGTGKTTILIIASIHGDEAAGTPLVKELETHLAKNPQLVQGRKVILLPNVNPDGVDAGTPHNARGIDINRDFSFKKSQPETLAIISAIKYFKPNRIISLRQLDGIDYDGPGAESLAFHMKRQCDFPIKRWGTSPGSLGEYGVDKDIPVITFGLSKKPVAEDQLWKRYGSALVAAITYSGKSHDEWKVHLEKGQRYLRSGKCEAAAEEFVKCQKYLECYEGLEKASACMGEAWKRHLNRGNRLYKARKYKSAIQSFRKCQAHEECRDGLAKSQEKLIEPIVEKGKRLYEQKRYEAAKREFNKCSRYKKCREWLDKITVTPPLPEPVKPDNQDQCPDDPQKTEPGECGCGKSDADTDNDKTADCNDKCPNDPDKTAPGKCGCGKSDADTDNDGTPDCKDNCPNDPDKTAPGKCDCGESDADCVRKLINEKNDLNGAKILLEQILAIDPDNKEAKEMLKAIE